MSLTATATSFYITVSTKYFNAIPWKHLKFLDFEEDNFQIQKFSEEWAYYESNLVHSGCHPFGTKAYLVEDFICLNCGEEAPESIKMIIQLQELKKPIVPKFEQQYFYNWGSFGDFYITSTSLNDEIVLYAS